MDRGLASDSTSCCLSFLLPCNLVQLTNCALCCGLKTTYFHWMISLLSHRDGNYTENIYLNDDKEEEEGEGDQCLQQQDNTTPSNHERHDMKDELISYDDITTVMGSLGVEEWQNVQKQNHDLVQKAHEFLDSKNASLEELKESFYVFDRNEDGYISAFELWSVLRRLGMKEGMRYEDCEEMIRVYDKDGDGRISFGEFKYMMEQAL